MGQVFSVPGEIKETPNSIPNSISYPYARVAALWDFAVPQGKNVPSPESAPPGYVACLGEKKFEPGLPEVTQVDGTGRTRMKDIDNLNELLSLFDEPAWFDEALFMYDGEIKSPATTPPGYVARLAEKKIEPGLPEVTQVDGTGRTYMKYIDNLNEAFSLFDEPASLDGPLFMYYGEIKRRRSAMCANVVSLTMPVTPITGRSSANSMGDFNLYLDSGASRNMVFIPALLSNRRDPPAGSDQFVAADGVRLAVIGYGDIDMDNFRIPGVYLVRGLTVNLISVGDLASSHKVSSCFAGNECNLMVSGTRIGGAIRLDSNQYLLRFLEIE